MFRPRTYDEALAVGTANGIPKKDLYALAPANDPYASGTPAQVARARWFAALWRRFGFTDKVHLRRVHYQVISQHDPIKADGTPYLNTVEDWQYLCDAAKHARYQKLVPVGAIEDHKHPAPHIYASERYSAPEPEWGVSIEPNTVPKIAIELAADVDFSVSEPYLYGYDYESSDQPVHVEVWIEKSTMNSILIPLCEELGTNLVTSEGFQTLTAAAALCERARVAAAAGKPTRIFYISDFDPAGDAMPTALSRQVEYWQQYSCPDADIRVDPICLTREQVVSFDLPPVPFKDSDKRVKAFTGRYAIQYAVELDALESLYPGTLDRLVRNAIAPYRDHELDSRLRQTGRDARRMVRDEWHTAIAEAGIADQLDAIQARIAERAEEFRPRLQALADEWDAQNEADQTELNELYWAMRRILQEKRDQIELPERPQAEHDGDDGREWLYDSSRSYLDQLAAFKARKNGVSLN